MQLIRHEPDMVVCGEASSGEAAFAALPDLRPDAVVMDLSLPGVNGIELIKRLGTLGTCGAILVVSAHDEALYAERALAAGALGYVMKHEAAERVVDAIRSVLRGRLYLPESLRERLALSKAKSSSATNSSVSALTDREVEVFDHFGRGQTTAQIAECLGLSPKTIESHRVNIKKKLGIKHAAEFAQRSVVWVERAKASSGPVEDPG